MAFVFLFLAAALAAIAWRCTGGMRVFFAICCLLNLAGIAKAIYTEDPYAFKLRPNPHSQIETERR